MALFTIKNRKTYKAISGIIEIVVPLAILLFVIGFIKIMYNGISGKEYSKFCYALFAANAILCNCLLAFGRSPIFIGRYSSQEQKLIYMSATMFLYAAILGFFLSGWIYVNTDKSFLGAETMQSSPWGQQFILGSLATGLSTSVILSLAGIAYFFRWSNKAFGKTCSELDEIKTK